MNRNAVPRPTKPVNVNEVVDEHATLGQRAADLIARVIGSWPFIICQSIVLSVWVALNVTMIVRHWDPYPFILMNLVLSLQAAYAAPVIMMSQNRQDARDRLQAHNDFLVNQKAEAEVREVLDLLKSHDDATMGLALEIRGAVKGGEHETSD